MHHIGLPHSVFRFSNHQSSKKVAPTTGSNKMWTNEGRMFDERIIYLNKSTSKFVIIGVDIITFEPTMKICDRATGLFFTIPQPIQWLFQLSYTSTWFWCRHSRACSYWRKGRGVWHHIHSNCWWNMETCIESTSTTEFIGNSMCQSPKLYQCGTSHLHRNETPWETLWSIFWTAARKNRRR